MSRALRGLLLTTILATSALFSGCTAPSTEVPGELGPWQEQGQTAQAGMAWGCGMCAATPEVAEFHWIFWDSAGGAMRIDFSAPTSFDGDIEFVDSADQWAKPYLMRLQTQGLLSPDGVRIHEIAAGQSSPRAMQILDAKLASARTALEPATGTITYTDCAPDQLILMPGMLRSEHGCGIESQGGWRDVRAQLVALQEALA